MYWAEAAGQTGLCGVGSARAVDGLCAFSVRVLHAKCQIVSWPLIESLSDPLPIQQEMSMVPHTCGL